ncbi:MAG: universal stress protein [Thermodesulfobacteriota bacterium]
MKILVAVDKNEESQQALRYCCHLLEHFEAEVDGLYVKPNVVESVAETSYAPFTTRGDVEKAIETEAEKTVEEIFEACEICLEGKVPCAPLVAVGDPADEIINAATEGMYDLIVLGSQGRSRLRGFLLGSVHAKILHHALQPVLIMRNFRPIQKILVAYRGSRCDQGALEFIAPLFARKKPDITILHVQETALGETPEVAEACLLNGEDTLKKYGFTPNKKLAQGDFVDEILKAVDQESYDLLVLGAYGHKRPRFLKMISDEALDLVRLSTPPVLVFRDKMEI